MSHNTTQHNTIHGNQTRVERGRRRRRRYGEGVASQGHEGKGGRKEGRKEA